jgi:hypothetical protein
MLVSILEREPKSVSSLAIDVPEALEWIVTKTLMKDCDDRYQTARELLTDLRRLNQRLSAAAELERSVAPELPKHRRTGGGTGSAATPLWSLRSKKRQAWALLLVATVVLVVSVAIWKGRAFWFGRAVTGLPVVVLMDSPLPERVYDPETRKNGGTNSDDITDILRDLPIEIHKENTSPIWHREDQVLRQNPTLIIIHRACFSDYTGPDPHAYPVQLADSRMGAFLGYIGLGSPTTKFLVYTRRPEDQWASDLEKRFPQLKGRVFTINVPGGTEQATFRDAATAKMLKERVQSILGLH